VQIAVIEAPGKPPTPGARDGG